MTTPIANPISLIFEYTQKFKLDTPSYTTRREGPDHKPSFVTIVNVDNGSTSFTAEGSGKTLKESKNVASANLVKKYNIVEALKPVIPAKMVYLICISSDSDFIIMECYSNLTDVQNAVNVKENHRGEWTKFNSTWTLPNSEYVIKELVVL